MDDWREILFELKQISDVGDNVGDKVGDIVGATGGANCGMGMGDGKVRGRWYFGNIIPGMIFPKYPLLRTLTSSIPCRTSTSPGSAEKDHLHPPFVSIQIPPTPPILSTPLLHDRSPPTVGSFP